VPKEIILILGGAQEKAARAYEAQARQDHNLAVLISYAFHDPGKMPDPAGRSPQKPQAENAAQTEMVRGFFMLMAQRNDKK